MCSSTATPKECSESPQSLARWDLCWNVPGSIDASSHCEEVNFGVDVQVLLLQGADLLTMAEAVTMAPKEEQWALNRVGEVTKLTKKNGAAVVKSIDLKDKYKNIRAKLAQDITTNTHEEAGVAPWHALLLRRALRRGISGATRTGMMLDVDDVVAELTKQFKPMAIGKKLLRLL